MSALDDGGWSTPVPCCFTPRASAVVSSLEGYGEEKYFLRPPGLKHQAVQTRANRYTDYAIPHPLLLYRDITTNSIIFQTCFYSVAAAHRPCTMLVAMSQLTLHNLLFRTRRNEVKSQGIRGWEGGCFGLHRGMVIPDTASILDNNTLLSCRITLFQSATSSLDILPIWFPLVFIIPVGV
jgi:hypothetical protein